MRLYLDIAVCGGAYLLSVFFRWVAPGFPKVPLGYLLSLWPVPLLILVTMVLLWRSADSLERRLSIALSVAMPIISYVLVFFCIGFESWLSDHVVHINLLEALPERSKLVMLSWGLLLTFVWSLLRFKISSSSEAGDHVASIA